MANFVAIVTLVGKKNLARFFFDGTGGVSPTEYIA
jgi:hypothetical protein